MDALELERKFLVTTPPADLERHPASRILQGYLVIAEDGSEVRVRRRAGRTWLTVKRGRGLVRREEEVEITAAQFDRLWPLTEARRIEKIRYEIDLANGPVIELDVYEGALSGLLVAEVEFPSVAAAGRFVPPSWFGEDVTNDDAYKNRQLALDGPPKH
ncbi:MAG: CYTH domain-containing protein [Solirubrobacteraceae bacterium]